MLNCYWCSSKTKYLKHTTISTILSKQRACLLDELVLELVVLVDEVELVLEVDVVSVVVVVELVDDEVPTIHFHSFHSYENSVALLDELVLELVVLVDVVELVLDVVVVSLVVVVDVVDVVLVDVVELVLDVVVVSLVVVVDVVELVLEVDVVSVVVVVDAVDVELVEDEVPTTDFHLYDSQGAKHLHT